MKIFTFYDANEIYEYSENENHETEPTLKI